MLKSIKRFFGYLANVIRKIWNMPSDGMFFIKQTFSKWFRSLKMLWSVAEVAEFPQVILLSISELWHSAKDSWSALSSHIQIRQKVRFQIQSCWIDRVIYEV